MADCKLRAAQGQGLVHCDEETCVFWRALEHLGADEGPGCAIQHYQLLADESVAAWLMSVKDRVERTTADGVCAEPAV